MIESIWNSRARVVCGALGLAGVVLAAASVDAAEFKVCPSSGADPIVLTPPSTETSGQVNCFRNGIALSAGQIKRGLFHDVELRAGKFAALDTQYPNASYRFAFAQGFNSQNAPTCSVTDFHADGFFAGNSSAACEFTSVARISAWIGIIN